MSGSRPFWDPAREDAKPVTPPPVVLPRPKPRRRAKTSHTCDVCGAVFDRPSSLEMHQRTHTGKRPFPCEAACGMAFQTKSNATRHYKGVHLKIKPTRNPPSLSSKVEGAGSTSRKSTSKKTADPKPKMLTERPVLPIGLRPRQLSPLRRTTSNQSVGGS